MDILVVPRPFLLGSAKRREFYYKREGGYYKDKYNYPLIFDDFPILERSVLGEVPNL